MQTTRVVSRKYYVLTNLSTRTHIGGKTKRAIYDQSKTCLELA